MTQGCCGLPLFTSSILPSFQHLPAGNDQGSEHRNRGEGTKVLALARTKYLPKGSAFLPPKMLPLLPFQLGGLEAPKGSLLVDPTVVCLQVTQNTLSLEDRICWPGFSSPVLTEQEISSITYCKAIGSAEEKTKQEPGMWLPSPQRGAALRVQRTTLQPNSRVFRAGRLFLKM